MESLKEEWFNQGIDSDLDLRIGINTGYATVGVFGSKDRMDYTAMGGEVNLASRLEANCEAGEITISHSTYVLIKDKFACRPKETLSVKGIPRPIRIYQVDWKNPNPPN